MLIMEQIKQIAFLIWKNHSWKKLFWTILKELPFQVGQKVKQPEPGISEKLKVMALVIQIQRISPTREKIYLFNQDGSL